MLGWALKRGGAKDASGLDDTQIEQPDTPAPVFAVRALKTALFGTPAPKSELPETKAIAAAAADTPAKPVPAGILLTPGTGTTRRKRVSFDHDTKAGANGIIGGRDTGATGMRPKTRLTQALENSRKNKKQNVVTAEKKPTVPSLQQPKDHDDIWEEVDDDHDDDDGEADMTVDLNEPHSRSGKYWKSTFESYHADAKAEMEKLVKYKQLAKSYAKIKDSEAMDLQQKLKEEQERVRKMEENLGQLRGDIQQGRLKGDKGSRKDSEMVADLQKQTALAKELRLQVEELEEMLVAADQEPDSDRRRRKAAYSPRTAKTLIEANRQLKRAKAQAAELNEAQDEVRRLKADLAIERQKSGKLAEENRKLAADLSRSSSKTVDLERKLDESRTEARTKERELRRLRSEHDQLKENAKLRFAEAEQILAKKNDAISGLKEEIRALKEDACHKPVAGEDRLITGEERKTLRRKSYLVANTRLQETAEEDSTAKILEYDGPRSRGSITNALSLPQLSSNIHMDKDARDGDDQRPGKRNDQELLTSSRALRHRIRTDMGKNGSSSSVLSDRANLQDTGRPEKSDSNRQSHQTKDTAEPSLPTLPRSSKATDDDDLGLRRRSSRSSAHRKASGIRPSSADSEAPKIDLVHSHFARLGDTVNTSAAWDISTVKTSLPAERRAAAIARLQRKKAERARTERAESRKKENFMPA